MNEIKDILWGCWAFLVAITEVIVEKFSPSKAQKLHDYVMKILAKIDGDE